MLFCDEGNQICTLYTSIKRYKITPWVHVTTHKMFDINSEKKNFYTSRLVIVVIVNIKPNVARKIVIIH